VSESAVRDKPLFGLGFGAKPAQSETAVGAAAERRPPGEGRSGERWRSLPSVIARTLDYGPPGKNAAGGEL
jgi:hypothetical protein